MNVALCDSNDVMNKHWQEYLASIGVEFKLLNFYESDIVDKMFDCDIVFWHFHQGDPKDRLFAKQLLFSLQTAGKKVFPDIHTSWHFDDKLGQKYLLEAIGAPMIPTWVFYDKNEALKWVNTISFPIVSKLRGGAGSQNVRLVSSKFKAKRLIRKAFGRGFPAYNPMSSLKERIRKYGEGNKDIKNIIEGVARFFLPPKFSLNQGRERGYIYFQEFIPGNDHDIRVIVIGDKAFAIKRLVRKNDFRASGSGKILYDRCHFQDTIIALSFRIAERLMTQCVAFDFVHMDNRPLITEVSYGFVPQVYDNCTGYWDRNLVWHEGKFNPYGWMVDNLLEKKT